ncbi:MAG: hypothetical protein RSC49_01710 [Clostridium sp.]
MAFLKQILIIFAIAVVALIVYNMVKPFIFSKLKLNKWVVLVLLIATFFTPALFPQLYANFITSTIFFILITILALTFMDLVRSNNPGAKTKEIVGRPKPNPKRAK